jgi:hypothetical protein
VRHPIERQDQITIVIGAVVGVAVGMALHYADSLAPDRVVIGFLAKIALAVLFVVALAVAGQIWVSGRPAILAVTLAMLGGVILAYPFGPSIASGVGVAGSYSMMFEQPAGTPPASGTLVCDWAPGRERVARLTGTQARIAGSDLSLSVDFYGVRASLDAAPGNPSFLSFGPDALQPAEGAPARPPDDASGTVRLDLIRYTTDGAGPDELVGTLHWECQPAPST